MFDPMQFRGKHLVDSDYVLNMINFDCPFQGGHGAMDGFLGSGMLYYAFAYALKAKVSVCLGSGGGFVPRLLRQAQRAPWG